MANQLFPLRRRPSYSYKEGAREYGAWRSGGRKHAGCDLLADRGTDILAIEDGKVIQGPYYFYEGTYALEVKHDSGIVVRYGEILQTVPRGIAAGARVSRGQVIAHVGELNSGSSMLHFEMYRGTEDGALTTGSGPYRRRSDLMDPTPFLDRAPLVTDAPPRQLKPGEARANHLVSSILNLRSQPRVDASVVTTISPGIIVKLVRVVSGGPYTAEGSSRNDWVELNAAGQSGFAAAIYVETGPEDGQPTDQAGSQGTARVNTQVSSTLNVRSQAHAASAVIAALSPGMTVRVIARVSGEPYIAGGTTRTDWVQVKSGEQQGFVAGYYVDLEQGDGDQPIPNALGTVNSAVSHSLNVRERPEMEATILFTLAPGESFEMLEPVTGDEYAGGRKDWQHIRHRNGTGYAAGFYISINQQPNPLTRWGAILPNVPTTGASAMTASQDGLAPGIAASEKMAQHDLERIKMIASRFTAAAARYGIPAALLAAMASRESRGGTVLTQDGWGDHGNGFGILQVDKRSHKIEGSESPISPAHVEQATGILARCIDAVQANHPDWHDIYILKGGVAAYNFGPSNVHTISGMDIGTTGNDYSSDVIARARYYLQHIDLPMFRQ